MDDFLGTSIQYSEYQIKKLEEEYARNKEKEVQELIESGFLDTDYEDSCGEYSDSETDVEMKEIMNYDSSSSSSPIMNLSSSSLNSVSTAESLSSPSSSCSSFEEEKIMKTESNNLALNIPFVDDTESNAGFINDVINIYENNNNDGDGGDDDIDENEEIEDEQNEEAISFEAIEFIHHLFGDIKHVLLLLIIALTLPHFNDPHQGKMQHDHNHYYYRHDYFRVQHHVHWFWGTTTDRNSNTHCNEDEDEREEYIDPKKQQQQQLQSNKLNIDIISTISDHQNQIFEAKICRHEIPIKRSDLYQMYDGGRKFVQPQIPRLLFVLNKFPKIPNIRKETMSDPAAIGSQFERKVLTFGTLLSFVGLAYFMSSAGGMDESIFSMITG